MPFVKLDCGILESSLWTDRDAREIFITALLMAVPWDTKSPVPQLEVRKIEETGWRVPPGDYGFINAAGSGIVRRCGMKSEPGTAALERLGAPDHESKDEHFEGRRLVRVNGGYIVLNFMKYRDKDYTAAQRMRRLRERRKSDGVTANDRNVPPNVTQAEAEAEAETDNTKDPPPPSFASQDRTAKDPRARVGNSVPILAAEEYLRRCGRGKFQTARDLAGHFAPLETAGVDFPFAQAIIGVLLDVRPWEACGRVLKAWGQDRPKTFDAEKKKRADSEYAELARVYEAEYDERAKVSKKS